MGNYLDRLKELIVEHAGGKHTIFAKNAGIPTSTFQYYVDGRMPSPEHLIRICEVYNVNINWLLTGKGDKYIKEGDGGEAGPINNKDADAGFDINEFGLAVAGLKEIFDSADPVLLPAIQANIRAFQISVRRERQIQQQQKEINDLKDECMDLKERLSALEKRLEDRDEVKKSAAGGK